MIQKRKLAANIKQLAAEKNKSIAALERFCGCSQGLISRWAASESDEFSVLTKLTAMAEFLDVSLDELLGRGPPPASQTGMTDPIPRLFELTCSNAVQWHKLEADDESQIDPAELPPTQSGRMFSDAWWLLIDNCYFVLAAFCDDMSDTLESIELAVYCVVGHGIPVYPLPITNLAELQSLYVQLRIQNALSTAASCSKQQGGEAVRVGKTIDFGRAVNQR